MSNTLQLKKKEKKKKPNETFHKSNTLDNAQ